MRDVHNTLPLATQAASCQLHCQWVGPSPVSWLQQGSVVLCVTAESSAAAAVLAPAAGAAAAAAVQSLGFDVVELSTGLSACR